MDEQTLYPTTVWRGRKFRSRSVIMDDTNWKERAFADNSSGGGFGSCVWPPRSYACSFCKREFQSAQALGGHMNVHRRDRARLRQVQQDSNTTTTDNITTSLQHPACSPIAVYNHTPPKISFVASLPFSPAHASRMILQDNIRKRSVLPYAPEGSNLKMGKFCRDDREREKKQITGNHADVTYCLLGEEDANEGDLGGDRQGFVGERRNYYPVKELDLELRLGDRS